MGSTVRHVTFVFRVSGDDIDGVNGGIICMHTDECR